MRSHAHKASSRLGDGFCSSKSRTITALLLTLALRPPMLAESYRALSLTGCSCFPTQRFMFRVRYCYLPGFAVYRLENALAKTFGTYPRNRIARVKAQSVSLFRPHVTISKPTFASWSNWAWHQPCRTVALHLLHKLHVATYIVEF